MNDEYYDELILPAFEAMKSSGRASTSILQRRLRIGYFRASKLMGELERRRIVGPDNSASPREILVDLETYKFSP